MLNERRKITVEEYFSICKALGVDATFFSDRIQMEAGKGDPGSDSRKENDIGI